MFCEHCAPLIRSLTYDPTAEPRAELMSGSCIWHDEICRGLCSQCDDKIREWFHLRYCLTIGDSVAPQTLDAWQQFEREYSSWPFFRPERRSPQLADQVRRMVDHNRRRACIAFQRMNRESRQRQADQALSGEALDQ